MCLPLDQRGVAVVYIHRHDMAYTLAITLAFCGKHHSPCTLPSISHKVHPHTSETLAFLVPVDLIFNSNTYTSIFLRYWGFSGTRATIWKGAAFNYEASTIKDQGIDEQGKPAESDIDFINEE